MAEKPGIGASRPGSGVTLRDVAARAGVSTSTVARVVHGKGYVAEDTRDRVEAAIREGGFRLNAVASGLKSARTMTIGTLLHETLPNPFFAEVARGIEHGANEQDYNVLLYNARGSADREREGVEAFLSQKVDAVVFATPLDPANVELADRAGAAVVEVEKPLYGQGGSVLVDNYAGASAAMEHLISLGHETIGFIGEPLREEPLEGRPVERVVNERFGGYRDALLRHGLQYDDSLAVLGDYALDAGWESLRTGRDYTNRLLEQQPQITAIFAGSDLLAAGILQALYERGVRVPTQASVVGFDDTYAQHLTPPLSTVRQPMFEMGREAAALAIELAEADSPAAREVWLSTELIVRDSTGAPEAR
ncbi:MAG TPA: LacI family DNA-binding transcriptional regulator [Solirubrobacterales bacterium]|nr:LacI family DNA-binding transcriptional regulator [Solirubrobacterales bacterium]